MIPKNPADPLPGRRDERKPRYDLIPLPALDRLADAMKKGCERYGFQNYLGFDATQKRDVLNHAIAHLYSLIEGDAGEDHLGHAMANLAMYAHLESK